jgi:AraC-like DNA-binding protein
MTKVWNADSMLGFVDVRRKLPVRNQSLTQMGRGLLTASATVISGSDAALYYATIGKLSHTMTELNSGYTGILVPIRWRGEFLINGAQVRPAEIYLPQDKVLFEAHGEERTTVGISVLREHLIATIAALQGVAPDDVSLDGGILELSPADMTSGRRSLTMLLNRYIDSCDKERLAVHSAEQLVRQVTQLLISLYLLARPAKTPRVRSAARLTRIVRTAEQRFAAAPAGPLSLADLCVAAGVSQVTLCHAFMVVCGSSPMGYFKKRRLTGARLALLRGDPETDLVKCAALGAGLTHMGRFSAEYHQLFGELPTATLNQTQH